MSHASIASHPSRGVVLSVVHHRAESRWVNVLFHADLKDSAQGQPSIMLYLKVSKIAMHRKETFQKNNAFFASTK